MSSELTIVKPDTSEIEAEAHALVARAEALVIGTAADAKSADDLLRFAVAGQRRGKEIMRPAVDAGHKAHKAALAAEAELIAPFRRAEAIVSPKLLTFKRAEEAKAREREAEIRRQQQKEAEERRLADAVALEARGAERDEVDAALSAPLPTPPPVIMAPAAPKLESVNAVQVTWRFRITDPNLLPREYLIPDQSALDAIARAQKGQTRIPGGEAYAVESLKLKRT